MRDHSHPGLGRGKVRKARLAAQAGEGSGEDDLDVAESSQSPGRLAADQKPAKAADAPERIEVCRGELPEIDLLAAAVVRR